MRSHQEADLIAQFAGEVATWEGGREIAERTLKMLRSLMGIESAWVLSVDARLYAATRPGAPPASFSDLRARHLPALAAGRSVTALVPDVDSAVLTLLPIRSEDSPPRTLGLLLVEDPSSDAGSAYRLTRLRRFATVLARILRARDLGDADPADPNQVGSQRKASKPA